MSFDSTIHAKAVDLAKSAYRITAAAGSGHPTTAASLSHLTAVLMYQHMRYEPANPDHPAADRLVLSEGHAVPILYAAMADLGVHYAPDPAIPDATKPITRDLIETLRAADSPIDGHPMPTLGMPFFDAATGSLGQGLSIAAGLAIAARLDGLDKRFFVIIGDGEAREGQVWEAVDFIKEHQLTAVCPIFNCNGYGQTDAVAGPQTADVLAAKLAAAGYTVVDFNGHRPSEIAEALSRHAQDLHNPSAPPVALIARTVKGWGSASQQGNGHHGTAVTGETLEKTLAELDATGKQLGAAAITPLKRGLMSPNKPAPPEVSPALPFDEAMKSLGQGDLIGKPALATRKAYGHALRHAAHRRSDVVALDAEVSNSTGSDVFRKDPALKDRFVECRIAEQNMVSVALGLAAGGKVPFASTFGKFLSRAFDQVETAILSGQPIKLVGSHAGATLGPDGPSQMAMADVAFMRAFSTMKMPNGTPGMITLTPADAYATHALTQLAADHPGSVYLRTLRSDVEVLYSADTTFSLDGHEVLVEGRDLLICATGYMVHEVNRALQKLDDAGIDATVVDLYALPFNDEALADLANSNNGMVLTVEDTYGAAYGSAVADALAATGDGFTVHQMHARKLPKSARQPDEMLTYLGLSADDIAAEAMKLLAVTPA